MNERDMEGKVCLVTGGNGVIGQATAVGLAQHGADVILACRSRHQTVLSWADIPHQIEEAEKKVARAEIL